MSFTVTALIVLGVWMLIAVLTSFGMARRGHSAFSWALLGAIFGPLVIPLVFQAIAEERDRASRVLRVGARATGPLSVLVGVDGSEESVAAVNAAVSLFGSRLERITLAWVVSYEAADGTPSEVRDEAAAELERLAQSMLAVDPDTVLLAGRPAEALVDAAIEGGYHVLAVGSRGRGAAKALLGSVARQLAGNMRLPVLIVGKDAVPTNIAAPMAVALRPE
jgi:nucleotide-binding universal stress UspA family protein